MLRGKYRTYYAPNYAKLFQEKKNSVPLIANHQLEAKT